MVPKTDMHDSSPEEFYDSLAGSYDAMTLLEKRFVQELPFLRVLVENTGVKTALDAGAGSGFHAIALSKLGVTVTAADVAGGMLEQLQANAEAHGVTVRTLQSSFQELAHRNLAPVDAVFCMGNSIAHLLEDRDLDAALRNFHDVLKPGGTLFVQGLNYDRILTAQERIISIRQAGDQMFVRFYDFLDDLVRFNILVMNKRGDAWTHTLRSTLLRPRGREVMTDRLVNAGFAGVEVYGGIARTAYDSRQAQDLFLVARRTEMR